MALESLDCSPLFFGRDVALGKRVRGTGRVGCRREYMVPEGNCLLARAPGCGMRALEICCTMSAGISEQSISEVSIY